MKRSSITPRPKDTLDTLEEGRIQLAQHLVDHARWQDSKGKNLSETGFGTQNPRLALKAARELLASTVFKVDAIGRIIDPSSASRVVLSLLNPEGIRAREGRKPTSKSASHYTYVTVTGEAGEQVRLGDTLTAKQVVAYSLQK